jgi:adenine-specific DNA-methyltransferase
MTQAKKQNDTRLNLASHDAVGERIEQLKALLPEIFVEGQLDPERLRQHLGDFSKIGAERFGLNWAGKAEAIRSLQIPSHGTLVPLKDQSVNFDESENMIIEGDNLEVLKLLQKSYHGKIKMIYIDPPYNTGGDFIYPDNFKEGLDTYLRYSGQATEQGFKVSTNSENGGRYHSNWLNMMYPRLFMAKNLLRDDGAIFVSIDDNEIHNLKAMMNEIFGEENFVSQITVLSNPRGRQSDKFVATSHEYVLIYARNSGHFSAGGSELTDKQLADYKHTDENGKPYRLLGLRQRGAASLREDRPQMYFPIYVNPDDLSISLTKQNKNDQEVLPKKSTGEDGRWSWGKEKVQKDIHLLEARLISGRNEFDIFVRDALHNGDDEEEKTSKLKSVWLEKEINYQNAKTEIKELFGESVMDYPKPTYLIKRIIDLANLEDGICMDFFAGSGTTAHSIISRNFESGGKRKYILIQLPEKISEDTIAYKAGFRAISEITRERVKRAEEKLFDSVEGQFEETNLGTFAGFKAFRLTSSNFKLWDASAGSKDADGLAKQLELYADNLLPDRSQDDILYEVILKAGQPLTAKIEKIEVAGQQVFSIDGGAMLICLEDPIKEETLVGMLEYQPAIMVTLDKAFHGNDQLKTNIKLQAEATGESEQSRVLFKTV